VSQKSCNQLALEVMSDVGSAVGGRGHLAGGDAAGAQRAPAPTGKLTLAVGNVLHMKKVSALRGGDGKAALALTRSIIVRCAKRHAGYLGPCGREVGGEIDGRGGLKLCFFFFFFF
jgi:hypothetical protein